MVKYFVETRDGKIIEVLTAGTSKLPINIHFSSNHDQTLKDYNNIFKKPGDYKSYFNYGLRDAVSWDNIRKMWYEEW